jgi:hypothetical protein
MWRDFDPRWPEDERQLTSDVDRPDPGRCGRAATEPRDVSREDPRDIFSHDLSLPRGVSRERVEFRGQTYELRGSEVRTLATVGAFRVVPASDLRDHAARPAHVRNSDLRHLREQGLIRTVPLISRGERTTVVTLTNEGRDLLDGARRPLGDEPRQAFYAGISRPRELSHDAQIYRAYEDAADRIDRAGGRVRRVVLEVELKREYQRLLQAPHRRRRQADEDRDRDRLAAEVAAWAQARELPVLDDHVQFPDVRLEYDDRDGRRAYEDVEVMTPHYRGAHAAGKARAGFSQYRGAGARVGGRGGRAGRFGGISGSHAGGGRRAGRGCDPHLAEEFLR